MSTVYVTPISHNESMESVSGKARHLLEHLVAEEGIAFEDHVPLKVHFGEAGNVTYIRQEAFDGIIDYLAEAGVASSYIETNVLYSGKRMTADVHRETAYAHGFNRLPIIIADGDAGENYTEIEIQGRHFSRCKVGAEFSKYNQMVVLSHFKGHRLAGFGGAVKQLAMGCAARGGKLAQHANSTPFIIPIICKNCGSCQMACPVDAITLGRLPRIDKSTCIGCASCIAVCPQKAIIPNMLRSLSKSFHERLAEYALAAQQGKRLMYVSYVMSITRGCDCEGHAMKPIANDLCIAASTDPVAIDRACLDMLDQRAGKKVFGRGRQALDHAERIGLGSQSYSLVNVPYCTEQTHAKEIVH